MDSQQFEEISRRVAAAKSRRAAVGLAITGVGAAVFGLRSSEAPAAAADAQGIPVYHCRIPGELCPGGKSDRCCTGKCKRGICACNGKGQPCYKPFGGALCCSGKCKGSGKCG